MWHLGGLNAMISSVKVAFSLWKGVVPSHYPNVALTLSLSHGAKGLLLQPAPCNLYEERYGRASLAPWANGGMHSIGDTRSVSGLHEGEAYLGTAA